MAHSRAPVLLLGIGNLDRGDDAAGRMAIRLLRHRVPTDVEVAELEGEATSLLAVLEDRRSAVIVDACRSEYTPGSVQRFDVNQAPLPAVHFSLSTHSFGLPAAIELARSLQLLPPRCIVYAMEGQCFDSNAGLSPAVAAAIRHAAPNILADLEIKPS